MSYTITQEFIETMNRPTPDNKQLNYFLIMGFSEIVKALEEISHQMEILTLKVRGIGLDLETIKLRGK